MLIVTVSLVPPDPACWSTTVRVKVSTGVSSCAILSASSVSLYSQVPSLNRVSVP